MPQDPASGNYSKTSLPSFSAKAWVQPLLLPQWTWQSPPRCCCQKYCLCCPCRKSRLHLCHPSHQNGLCAALLLYITSFHFKVWGSSFWMEESKTYAQAKWREAWKVSFQHFLLLWSIGASFWRLGIPKYSQMWSSQRKICTTIQ